MEFFHTFNFYLSQGIIRLFTTLYWFCRTRYFLTCLVIYIILFLPLLFMAGAAGLYDRDVIYYTLPGTPNEKEYIEMVQKIGDTIIKPYNMVSEWELDYLKKKYARHHLNSVISNLYENEKLNDFFISSRDDKRLIVKLITLDQPKHPIDTLTEIKQKMLSFQGFELCYIIRARKILQKEMAPHGFIPMVSGYYSFAGPVFDIPYTNKNMFLLWLWGFLVEGMLLNPICFIGIPVGICFLIFSKKARQDLIRILVKLKA